MPFSRGEFAELRAVLYHMTCGKNLPFIRQERCLWSTEELYRRARRSLPSEPRTKGDTLEIGGFSINIRDQSKLYEGNIEWRDGWTMERLIRELNRRVFFWAQPNNGAEEHVKRYSDDESPPVILKIPTQALLRITYNSLPDEDQDGPEPFFCQWNSGNPRYRNPTEYRDAAPSPRGENTFVIGARARFNPGEAKEVTFLRTIELPSSTRIAHSYDEADLGEPLFPS